MRADVQKTLASLRERLHDAVLIQEGEEPLADSQSIIEEINAKTEELRTLIIAINRTNLRAKTAQNRSLTEAIADRDILAQKHAILNEALKAASVQNQRYSKTEIRWVRTVDIHALQKDVDAIALEIRNVNTEIQSANWTVELE